MTAAFWLLICCAVYLGAGSLFLLGVAYGTCWKVAERPQVEIRRIAYFWPLHVWRLHKHLYR